METNSGPIDYSVRVQTVKYDDTYFNDSIKKKKITKDPKEKELKKFDVSKKRRSPKEFLKKKKASKKN